MGNPPLWILAFLALAAALAFARRDAPAQPYRTFWQRLWAGWLDAFVVWPLEVFREWAASGTPALAMIGLIAAGVGGTLYGTLCHALWGQTVGKWVFGVCVLDVSEERLRPWQAVKRDAVPLALGVAWSGYAIGRGMRDFTRAPAAFMWTSAGWALLEVVTMLASPKRRALHDHIAGTVVVRVKPLWRRVAS